MKAGRIAGTIVAGTLVGALAAMSGVGPVARAATPARTAQALPVAKAVPIPVMVLGTYHMGNPGRDLHNARIAPVTTPAKQAELAALARRLAVFRPTVIAVEQDSDAPGLADPGYARFRPADLTTRPNEVVQIGYRVAAMTGARVIAVDVSERPGEPSYFPFEPVQDWAKSHPASQALLDDAQAQVGAFTSGLERDQSRLTVTQILAGMNGEGPGNQRALHHAFYNGVLAMGERGDQPGAELAGRWFTRNAKIFAKIMQATRPGDRVLVVYGAGHSTWLRRLAADTPGYRDVAVAPYLTGRQANPPPASRGSHRINRLSATAAVRWTTARR